jgi:hypothetical protein
VVNYQHNDTNSGTEKKEKISSHGMFRNRKVETSEVSSGEIETELEKVSHFRN